jgi:hypothetical protein
MVRSGHGAPAATPEARVLPRNRRVPVWNLATFHPAMMPAASGRASAFGTDLLPLPCQPGHRLARYGVAMVSPRRVPRVLPMGTGPHGNNTVAPPYLHRHNAVKPPWARRTNAERCAKSREDGHLLGDRESPLRKWFKKRRLGAIPRLLWRQPSALRGPRSGKSGTRICAVTASWGHSREATGAAGPALRVSLGCGCLAADTSSPCAGRGWCGVRPPRKSPPFRKAPDSILPATHRHPGFRLRCRQ